NLVHHSMTGEWSILNTNHFRLPKIEITDILSDGNGGLWVGTRGGGLVHRSVLDEWSVFDDKSGLPSNWITGLLADNNNGLWMSFGAWGVSGGLAHLSFTQKTTLVQSIQDEGTRTELLNDKRAAILIHPRGQGSGVTQALSIERMSAHIYRTLQNRGYDNDEIYFLSHKPDVDINGDGMVDRNVVDAPVKSFDKVTPRDLTHADVQQAFDWAKQKGKLDQPLLVVFVDHALTGQLRLDPFTEVLTAPDLNALLTDYQQATGSEVVVILEACHTGSLVNGLAGPNRLIITSTAEDQAYYENLGMFSFSKFFFDNLRRGESFYDAFQTVSGKLPTYGHPFNQQIPQLDDDGDGLANNTTDGRLAQKWCLNGCFGALSGEITLEAESVSGPVIAGQTTPLLVRAGITEGRIKRVWALVMTPKAAKQRNQEGFALIPTPIVNLTQQADDPSRWQGAFSEFQYRGDYVVTFMAEDNEGFITSAAPIVFTQAEGPEVPEFIAGPDPIPSQTVYQAGDQVRVTLPALPADQKQYIAVSYPDQSLYFMTGLNGLVLFDGRSVPVWEDSGKVAIDQPVTEFPKGEYIVYLLRLPTWIDLLSHPEEWRIGFSTFRVE
ncbi:MAG: two-component regulator propeller domain-containing protein, partial [Candidatus Parabeggiatoa sp.]|nr:two-component regulator propeller domain-containing protein [Candidatus Parabeggiatoa sp.]